MNPLSPISSFFSRQTESGALDLKTATQQWGKLPEPDLSQPHFHIRYLAVGLSGGGEESSANQLAMLALNGDGFSSADSFAMDIPASQKLDMELRDWMDFVSSSVLVSFRADFGLSVIRKLFQEACGVEINPRWIDLALLLPELFPESENKCVTMADWLAFFELEDDRNDAMTDALATGRLLLCVLARASEKGYSSPNDLMRAEKARRWLWSH
jgi:DNA polymerase III subunit epsilon